MNMKHVAVAAALTLAPVSAHAALIVGSSDLLSAAEADFLAANIAGTPNTFTKIYDYAPGDSTQDFHAAVDGTLNTVVVVKATVDGVDYRFGGFAALDWGGSSYADDQQAFLFSLDKSKLYTQEYSVAPGNTPYGVYRYNNYWATFGGGHDLFLGWGGSTNGYSNLGHTYGAPGLNYGTPDIQDELAGAYNFTWTEMEVFAVSTSAGAVPEPASWAMMIGGFALAGGAMRRRAAVSLRYA